MIEGSRAYREAGVDTEGGQKFVRLISDSVKSTFSPAVVRNFGSFAGMFDISHLKDYKQPLLVATTDGVGTKLRLAALFDRHETIGIDLVAMCANDILVTGGKALFFLDYIACGRLDPEKMASIVGSIAMGCRSCGAALIGGETAEHPGVMPEEDYDLAGFMVGVVEKDEALTASSIRASNAVIGIPSSGIHSNGLSLVRRIFMKDGVHLPDSEEDRSFLLNQILLRPTLIYEPLLRPLLSENLLLGLVHITGGGYYENIPRVLPEGVRVVIRRSDVPVHPVFVRIQERGHLDDGEMFSVFNMGTGMIAFTEASAAEKIVERINVDLARLFPDVETKARIIGSVEDRAGRELVEII